MGIHSNLPEQIDAIMADLQKVVESQEKEGTTDSGTNPITSQSKVTQAPKMDSSDYMVAFSGQANSYCVGIVDMIDSTKISANMHERDWCKYYSIFLNSMSKILTEFGGVAVKNGGDSLLYYFPSTSNTKRKFGFFSCLECSFAMIEAHDIISKLVKKESLPSLNYRVSADYGKVEVIPINQLRAKYYDPLFG